MSNERNELAALLNREGAYCGTCGYEGGPDECSDCRECLTRYADAILVAGYRKPRTITTAEELDALPEGAIVVGDWAAFQKVLGTWVMVGGPSLARPELPVLHIWEPQP